MIDISFDFRSDSKGRDPDTYSPTLNAYHRALWSKELPNGQVMELQSKSAPFVLNWRDFYFTSDTIIVEMSYSKNRKIMDRVYRIWIRRWWPAGRRHRILPERWGLEPEWAFRTLRRTVTI